MAKKENREGIALQCTVCKEINYLTSKNKKNTEGKWKLRNSVLDAIKQLLTKKRKRRYLIYV